MEKICYTNDYNARCGQPLNTMERIEAVDKKLSQINKLNKNISLNGMVTNVAIHCILQLYQIIWCW